MQKFIAYVKKINFVTWALVFLFSTTVILATYSLYLYAHAQNSKKASLVIFMQNSDTKDARSAVGRALVLKKNNAVDRVEVVFGGDGTIPLARADEDFKARLDEANKAGVVMSACGTGMAKNNISTNDLPGFVSVFPYGIIRTLDLVSKGYAVMQY